MDNLDGGDDCSISIVSSSLESSDEDSDYVLRSDGEATLPDEEDFVKRPSEFSRKVKKTSNKKQKKRKVLQPDVSNSDMDEGQKGGAVDNASGRKAATLVTTKAPPPKRSKNKNLGLPMNHEPATHGGHELLFQDDKTGRKKVNVSALRWVLRIIQDETAESLQSVSEELRSEGETVSTPHAFMHYFYLCIHFNLCPNIFVNPQQCFQDESRRVRVRSRNHVESILKEVRKTMGDVYVPERYVKLKDSVMVNANHAAIHLDKTNALRKAEIEASDEMTKKLEEKLATLREELNAVQARKERLAEVLEREVRAPKTSAGQSANTAALHPLLCTASVEMTTKHKDAIAPLISSAGALDESEGSRARHGHGQMVAPAPQGFWANFVAKLKSPYDAL